MIDILKWNKLIKEHYLSACKRNKNYSKKYSEIKMRNWWFSLLKKRPEKDVEEFILGNIYANNNNIKYHPV